MSANREFDWNDDTRRVLGHQPQTAIYSDPNGDIVIRQQGHYGPDEDSWVYFSPENVVAVLYGIIDAADLPYLVIEDINGCCTDIPRPDATFSEAASRKRAKAKDRTAAERQRRRRERKRQGAARAECDNHAHVDGSDRDIDFGKNRDAQTFAKPDE